SSDAVFLACGPEGLLHAFADFARLRNLDAYLSLETYMGCGYGVCNACPVSTSREGKLSSWPYAKTCCEGPVFSLKDIVI
ncbi:MAG: dihydroorotate dehydrogenase electron transfer subunit, partial [Planctomycetota bacterium]|nr:dihydroorotate dehydrogenase electron transfer subunit [Planctomycetota bacterium]